MKISSILLAGFLVFVLGCSQDSTGPGGDLETAAPEIRSLTAEKMQILYGGKDPAIITCDATGGNLTFKWEVDLGDIIPLNSSRSKVSFNGSACCVGEKIITCTVSNSKGSVSKSITITILEDVTLPEILVIEADKSEIHAGSNENASFVCYALGGNLSYNWQSDCGELTVDKNDKFKATFVASPQCKGMRTVTCTVSNEKGTAVGTAQIAVVD